MEIEGPLLTIITASTPLLLAALGELVTERSGVLNLGVEGMMAVGAVCGFAVAYTTGSATLGVFAAILAGICEVAGPIGMLRTSVSPGYGFTGIIVAFLGRLHPVGILVAGVLLALSYIGGEGAQIALGISDQITRVFQGLLLFFVLACDTFVFYRIRLVRPVAGPSLLPAREASHGN